MPKPVFFGVSAPFIRGNVVLPVQSDIRLLQNDLLTLLLTIPGERVMRPTYGTNLKNQLFEPIDNFSLSALRTSISSAIKQFEPRVQTNSILITASEDESLVEIKIVVTAILLDNKEFFVELALPIGGYEVQIKNV